MGDPLPADHKLIGRFHTERIAHTTMKTTKPGSGSNGGNQIVERILFNRRLGAERHNQIKLIKVFAGKAVCAFVAFGFEIFVAQHFVDHGGAGFGFVSFPSAVEDEG